MSEQQQTGQSAIISLPSDGETIVRSFLAPIVVAVAVGMGTAYLTAQDALARFDERQQQQARAIKSVEADVDDLADMSSQVDRLRWQIDRLEEQLDEVE